MWKIACRLWKSLLISLDPIATSFGVLTPLPGTPLFELAEREGLLVSRDWDKYDMSNGLMYVRGGLTPLQQKFWVIACSIASNLNPVNVARRPLAWANVMRGTVGVLLETLKEFARGPN